MNFILLLSVSFPNLKAMLLFGILVALCSWNNLFVSHHLLFSSPLVISVHNVQKKMFLLILDQDFFFFYSFHVKAFLGSICWFIQWLNKYLLSANNAASPGTSTLWEESFLSSKNLGSKFCLGKTYKSKLPSNKFRPRNIYWNPVFAEHWEHNNK